VVGIQTLTGMLDLLSPKIHQFLVTVKAEDAKVEKPGKKQNKTKRDRTGKESFKPEGHRKIEITSIEKEKHQAAASAAVSAVNAASSMEVDEVAHDGPPQRKSERTGLEEFEENLHRRVQGEYNRQQQSEEFMRELATQSRRLEPMWRNLKLNPRLEVDEGQSLLLLLLLLYSSIEKMTSPSSVCTVLDGYVISAFIPGMKKEDVTISTSKEGVSPILTLRGFRSPSLEEIALMRRQLVRAGIEPEDQAVMRIGMGRYGSFVEKFGIPGDVDFSEIDGGYNEGELSVILPKIRLVQIPQRFAGFSDWW